MKKLFLVCSVFVLASLTAFAQTNPPPVRAAAAHPPLAQKKPAAKAASLPRGPVSTVSPTPSLARNAELSSDQMSLYRRVADGRLLAPTHPHNYDETFRAVFHPWVWPTGRTEVRDTDVTIFPAGP